MHSQFMSNCSLSFTQKVAFSPVKLIKTGGDEPLPFLDLLLKVMCARPSFVYLELHSRGVLCPGLSMALPTWVRGSEVQLMFSLLLLLPGLLSVCSRSV